MVIRNDIDSGWSLISEDSQESMLPPDRSDDVYQINKFTNKHFIDTRSEANGNQERSGSRNPFHILLNFE